MAKSFVDTLCCKTFSGRKSGDPEATLCERWVAAKFAQFGLQPGGSEGYLQPFPILNNREGKAELALMNGYHGKKRYQNGEDFHLITNSGSGRVEAEIVFCGYGIAEPEMGRDDFAGINLQGKIALIYKAVPDPERLWSEQVTRDYKLKAAVSRGAKAVLFVHEPYAVSGAAIHRDAFFPNVPVILVSEHVVEDIFRGTGRRYETVKKDLKKDPQSFVTGKVMKIETRLKYNPDAQAANILAVVAGSGGLKREWIVIGGHMDHNGTNALGDVFYGADDNASGTAVVMELARGFASLRDHPKRSLLLVAFAAEEQGLLGSQYFVDHSPIPLESIVAMFDFDCCGLGDDGVGFGGAEHFPEIWESYRQQISPDSLKNMSISTHWGNGSDNYSFHEKGVPTFNYWSRGERSFYHHQEDLPQTIRTEALGGVGRAAADFIAYLANWDKPLIQPHHRARTWLYSGYTINLRPIDARQTQDTSRLAEMLNAEHLRGLKCATVGITAEAPYEQMDFWRQFCKEHGFAWASDASDIRDAIRKQQLSLLPIITELNSLDEGGLQLRNLKPLGAKIVYLPGSELDSARVAQCADLGMLFVVNEANESGLPKSAKRLVLFGPEDEPQLPGKDQLDNQRIAVSGGLNWLRPDSDRVAERAVYLNLNWGSSAEQEQSLRIIEELEQAGFTGDQIVYMLGENLLEILP